MSASGLGPSLQSLQRWLLWTRLPFSLWWTRANGYDNKGKWQISYSIMMHIRMYFFKLSLNMFFCVFLPIPTHASPLSFMPLLLDAWWADIWWLLRVQLEQSVQEGKVRQFLGGVPVPAARPGGFPSRQVPHPPADLCYKQPSRVSGYYRSLEPFPAVGYWMRAEQLIGYYCCFCLFVFWLLLLLIFVYYNQTRKCI